MRSKKLIPFEIIEKAVAGEPEAVNAVYSITARALSICPNTGDISTTIFKTV